jgi:hypothetical protein
MANLSETPSWETGVYQLETTDPVLGGASGVSNTATRQLANRTSFLYGLLKAVCDAQGVALTPTDLSKLLTALDGRYAPKTTTGVDYTTLPAGMQITYFSPTVPNGLLGIGTNAYALPRANYPDCVPLIGHIFGVGDGVSNFVVPAVPTGYAFVQAAVNGLVTAALGQLTPGDIKSHSHGVYDPGHVHSFSPSLRSQNELGYVSGGQGNVGDATPRNTGVATTNISILAAGGAANLPAGMFARFGITCGRVVA